MSARDETAAMRDSKHGSSAAPGVSGSPDDGAVPIVCAVALHKRYPDGDGTADAVVDVDLTLTAGELVVLAGPSGSGKSTLLALLGGLLTPTSGDVVLRGRSVVHMRDHHRAAYRRSHVGFVFQELGLIPSMTLLDNILLPLAPTGGEAPADVERALRRLTRFGLDARARTPVARLSGGERQRGAIVRALMHDPGLLLLDEPTAHIDADNAAETIRLLAELRDEGRTIFAATHDPRLIDDQEVDRVVTMRGGTLVARSRAVSQARAHADTLLSTPPPPTGAAEESA